LVAERKHSKETSEITYFGVDDNTYSDIMQFIQLVQAHKPQRHVLLKRKTINYIPGVMDEFMR
jgi:hypothetical protein